MDVVGSVAATQYSISASLIDNVVAAVLAEWARMVPGAIDRTWGLLGPRIEALTTAAQATAAATADPYLDALEAAYGLPADVSPRLLPRSLAGVSSSGLPLSDALSAPVIVTKQRLRQGFAPRQALQSGAATLKAQVSTQVADAGRAAEQVASASRAWSTHYVRMIEPGACSRCAIMAGRRFKVNVSFQRHPMCRCRTIPEPESVDGDRTVDVDAYFTSLPPAEQDRIFTKAGAEAIRNGANISRVVNARWQGKGGRKNQGMYTATVGGRKVLATTVLAGKRVRLMPEEIIRRAGDNHAEMVRLLKAHKYII